LSDNPQRLPRAVAADPVVGEAPARRIIEELGRHPEIEGFLNPATVRLIAITDEVTAGLGIEAVKQAKARQATAVDEIDVNAADAKLNQTEHAYQVKAWFFGIGGVLIGGALSAAPSVALTQSPPHPLIWWIGISVVFVLGLVFAVLGYPRRRR
jgi:hypothetical protein